jgi:hypothetical protein
VPGLAADVIEPSLVSLDAVIEALAASNHPIAQSFLNELKVFRSQIAASQEGDGEERSTREVTVPEEPASEAANDVSPECQFILTSLYSLTASA